MSTVTIYLSKEEEKLIEEVMTASNCSRYAAAKGVFSLGSYTLHFITDSRQLLIKKLKKLHLKRYKRQK